MSDKVAVIYHYPCADGFGAAWCVRRALTDERCEFIPGIHGEEPPWDQVKDKQVVIVDFSYPADVLKRLGDVAQSVLVLDHHKTAKAALVGFDRVPENAVGWLPDEGIYVEFDMNRSGAGMAWDHFFRSPRPALIDHIEDRDLWRFQLTGTREIQAAVFSYPYDFKVWDNLILTRNAMSLFDEGTTLERKHMKDIHELIEQGVRRANIGGHDVPVVNVPYTMSSDACHILAEGEPFAASYFDAADGRRFSLRSVEGGVDVSEIAQALGGGGHKHAAGFTAPHNWPPVKGDDV